MVEDLIVQIRQKDSSHSFPLSSGLVDVVVQHQDLHSLTLLIPLTFIVREKG